MPLPSQIRIDRLLTGVLIGTVNEDYIAQKVLPVISPGSLTGKVAKMGRDHYRLDFAASGPGTRAHRVDWTGTNVAYDALRWRVEHPVDDMMRAEYNDPFDAFRDGAMICSQKIWLKIEDLVSTLLTTAANYPTASKDTTDRKWDDDAAGFPVDDVAVGIAAIVAKTGVSPTRIYGACSFNVFQLLRRHTQVINYFLNTVPGVGTPRALSVDQVASALGLAGLEVGAAVKNTALEGVAETMAWVWGIDKFLIYAKTSTPSIMVPNLGYLVAPSIEGLPKGAMVAVDRYRDEPVTSDVVRATGLLDEILADTNLGFLYSQII